MDVKNLSTLIAVVDHRGFAAAGKAVGLSTSGVSLQIKALEVELGLSLFDRAARPPTLTSEGELFVRRAREVVSVWRNLTDSLTSESLTGILDLGAIPTIASGNLPLALSRLRGRNPGLRLQLTTGLSHELEDLLRRSSLDAALLAQPAQVEPGFMWVPFCEEPLMVIAPETAEGESDEDLLRAGPFIRFRRTAWAGQVIEQELRRRGIAVVTGMEVDTLEIIVGLVVQGLGVSVVPRRKIAEPFLPGIKAVPFGNPAVTRSLGILQRADNPRRHFVDQLLAELSALSRDAA